MAFSFSRLVSSSLLLLGLSASVSSVASQKTVLQVIQGNSELSALASVLAQPQYAAVGQVLNTTQGVTIFAPNNAAFANATLGNVYDVNALLRYHAIAASIPSSALSALQFPNTLLTNTSYTNVNVGAYLEVAKSGSTVTLSGGLNNNPKVVTADLAGSNGYVHIIDTVLTTPPLTSATAVAAGLTSLVGALQSTNLVSAVDNSPNVTIFAPNNAAFAAVEGVTSLSSTLEAHVVPGVFFSNQLYDGQTLKTLTGDLLTVSIVGGVVKVGGGTVLAANVITKNGVVHVVDRVLTVPSLQNNIIQNVLAVPALSTLASVVSKIAPGLIPVLSGPGPFTLFAPNNDAFAKAKLDTTQTDAIVATLTYHALAGSVKSSALLPLQFAQTLLNNTQFVNLGPTSTAVLEITKSATGTVTITFGIPTVNVSTVTVADIQSTNGYIHIVDTVFSIPSLSSKTAATAGLSTLVSAVVGANLVGAIDTTAGITILAPNNDAFIHAGLHGVDVPTVLTSHVVSSVAFSNALVNGAVLTTLSGAKINVVVTGGVITFNGAQVLIPNVLTANGVVHVIDTVLFAPDARKTIVANVGLMPQLSSLLTVAALYPAVVSTLGDTTKSLTLFAPTNDAFKAADLNVDVLDTLLYHVLPAFVPSPALGPLQFPATLLTNKSLTNLGSGAAVIAVSKDLVSNTITIQYGLPARTATVVVVDIASSNGVIHLVNNVFIIPDLTSATAVAGGLNQLVSFVAAAKLVSAVDTTAGITVLAPTDAAFTAAVKAGADAASLLLDHVFPAVVFSTQLTNGQQLTALSGKVITVGVKGGVYTFTSGVTSATLVSTRANILTRNGVVHVIDTVLNAPSPAFSIVQNVLLNPKLSVLASVVKAYPAIVTALSSPSSTLTLFAPSNDAFSNSKINTSDTDLVLNTLLYHVLPAAAQSSLLPALKFYPTLLNNSKYSLLGSSTAVVGVARSGTGAVTVVSGNLTANANVVTADIVSGSSFIHIIDEVLVIPSLTSATATAAGLTSLVASVLAAGLVPTIDTTPGITIFAPLNSAFAAVNIDASALKEVLASHVVNSFITSDKLPAPSGSVTVNSLSPNNPIVVSVGTDGTVTLNGGKAKVVRTNVLTKNAVVHVIDGVLYSAASAMSSVNLMTVFALIILAFYRA